MLIITIVVRYKILGSMLLMLFFIIKGTNTLASVTHNDSILDLNKRYNVHYKKDLIELISQPFHFRKKADSLKMKGNGPFISFIPVVGYAIQSGYTGALTTCTSFYSNRFHDKFSCINANAYYSQYHQFWTILNSNIFIENPNLHLVGDWRYYKFPTNTFGLGSSSSFSDILPVNFSYIRIYQVVYKEIGMNTYAGLGYNLDYHWNIKIKSTDGKALEEFKKYQRMGGSVSSGISLNLKYDSRKNATNPEGGDVFSLQFRPNFIFLGSDHNWQSVILDVRHYEKFPSSSGNILAFWSYDNITFGGTPPYLDMPSLGWDNYSNTGRGYVPGRFTGRNFLYAETEYRYAITRNGLLGGVIFGNCHTFPDQISQSLDKVNPGWGLGLRIKMNKFSNLNLSVDYGFGLNGSRGLFFNLGEVF